MRIFQVMLLTAACAAASNGQSPSDPHDRGRPAPDRRPTGPAVTSLPDGGVRVPLDTSRGQPVITARLNGRGPFRMVLDTGSGGLVLNQDLADELHLTPLGEVRTGDPSSPQSVTAQRIHVDSLSIGAAEFRDLEGISLRRAAPFKGDDAPRGVIGLPNFGGSLVTLDYPADQLAIESGTLPAPDDRDVLAYEIDAGGIPLIPIQVAGRTIPSHIDSGFGGAIALNEKYLKQVPLKGEPVVVGRGRTVSREFEIREAVLGGALRVGRNELNAPRIAFDPIAPNANLGSGFLADFAVTFDLRHQRVRLVRGNAGGGRAARDPAVVGAPAGRPRIGIALARRDDGGSSTLSLDFVAPDSPAEKAGLRAGDEILKINGHPVAHLAEDDVRALLAEGDSIAFQIRRAGAEMEIHVAVK